MLTEIMRTDYFEIMLTIRKYAKYSKLYCLFDPQFEIMLTEITRTDRTKATAVFPLKIPEVLIESLGES